MRQSAIGLSDSTWNPFRGCKPVSAGCENCWAERMAGRYAKKGQTYYQIAKLVKDRPTWTGKVLLTEDKLYDPLEWSELEERNGGLKARSVLVGTMTDIFYSKVPDAWRDHLFGVIALCGFYTFQIQTKYAAEMQAYFAAPNIWKRIERESRAIFRKRYHKPHPSKGHLVGPLQNTWLGVSVENQKTADERCSILLKTPAALRFVAAEPLIDRISLRPFLKGRNRLRWVIAGGESGFDARPANPQWVRALRDEAKASECPFFLHQWGAWLPCSSDDLKTHGGPNSVIYVWPHGEISVNLQKSDMKTMMADGVFLDGVEWNQMPKTSWTDKENQTVK